MRRSDWRVGTRAVHRQKKAKASGIPFLGLRVRAVDVRRHRYLRDHKLKHSGSLANVLLRSDLERAKAAELAGA